jgi:uncharacterized protein
MTTPADETPVEVTDDAAEHRYEITYGGELAGVAVYVDRPEGRAFVHTEMTPELEGHGLASRLVRDALDAEVAAGRTVIAECPYVVRWLQRHPDHPAHG